MVSDMFGELSRNFGAKIALTFYNDVNTQTPCIIKVIIFRQYLSKETYASFSV